MALTVVAKFVVKEEKREIVKAEALKLLAPTRAEKGCINYDLHQDNDDPNRFLFYENWESLELLEKHLNSIHLVNYRNATEGAFDEKEILKMSKIE